MIQSIDINQIEFNNMELKLRLFTCIIAKIKNLLTLDDLTWFFDYVFGILISSWRKGNLIIVLV